MIAPAVGQGKGPLCPGPGNDRTPDRIQAEVGRGSAPPDGGTGPRSERIPPTARPDWIKVLRIVSLGIPGTRCFRKPARVTGTLWNTRALPWIDPMAPTQMMKPGCFLDRDGVLIHDVGYLADPADLRLYEGAAAAVRRLNERGVPVILVTNQSGVARGYFAESVIADVHTRLREMLAAEGAHLDAIHHCPHHPDAADPKYGIRCTCRKPEPGMLRAAARDLRLDLANSFMIGDKLSDLEAGERAGCRTILVQTGKGRGQTRATVREAGFENAWVAPDITAAIELCLPCLVGRASD